jgi:hypothetical protein
MYIYHKILSRDGVNVASFVAMIKKFVTTRQVPVFLLLDWDDESVKKYAPLLKNIAQFVSIEYVKSRQVPATAKPMDVVAFLSDACFFVPDALLVALDALQFSHYVGGSFANSEEMVNIISTPSRFWKLPGTPANVFLAYYGTLLHDNDIVENYEYTADTWAKLHILHERKYVSPIPAIWTINHENSPGIAWDQVKELVVKSMT